ncbi:HpcH/HpaI aldolase/citrate lyase family protein [Steroidobacter flavus]|uniref:HpcH/HpaI aldolase/citrate lyase family protein n=1 Tax=Steroidobacter flavus TaxID=1842136 RepID=A0ABV8SYA6_9GAMM
MKLFRSLLFAPGNHARRIEKAFTLPADVVILDLEDACPVAEKVAARAAVVEALQKPRAALGYVRTNALSTEFGYGDLCAVVQKGVDGVVLTKVDGPEQIKIADWLISQLERERGLALGSIDLIPLIETAAGVSHAEAISRAAARVKRFAFGAGDFTADLGVRWSREETELIAFRSSLVLAARTAGIEPPIDLAWLNTKDQEGFGNSLRWACTLGFQGKLCIHPDHVEPINRAFAPTAEEIARAQRVVDAFREAEARGSAAFVLDGAMIDYAIVLQANRTLQAGQRAAGRA